MFNYLDEFITSFTLRSHPITGYAIKPPTTQTYANSTNTYLCSHRHCYDSSFLIQCSNAAKGQVWHVITGKVAVEASARHKVTLYYYTHNNERSGVPK